MTPIRLIQPQISYAGSPPGNPPVMLLGAENKVGLTARGKVFLAFDTATGAELWRWQAETNDTYPLVALADGGVIIKDGPKYAILNPTDL